MMRKKIMMVKTLATTLALSLLSIPATQAAEIGSVSTATATIVVNNPGVVSHALTAGAPLLAGPIAQNSVIASGAVQVSNQNNTFALRFTPGSCEEIAANRPNRCTFKGVNDENHQIDLSLVSDAAGADLVSDDNAWFIAGQGASGDNTYKVRIDAREQNLEADNYIVSVDAVEWQN
jgi:hypothetical protein